PHPHTYTHSPPHRASVAGRPAGPGPQNTPPPPPPPPTAKYFLVLLALCEPRLRSPSAAVVPGVTDVLARLRALPSCHGLTRSAVNYHIDYLVWTKLRLREPYEDGPGGGKREELAALALKFDLVREEHLALLPPRRPVARP
ncbi:serine/threonine protein kinase, partial [Kitasatospora sp. NPDC059811]